MKFLFNESSWGIYYKGCGLLTKSEFTKCRQRVYCLHWALLEPEKDIHLM
jgi:hypothetical protein